MARTDRPPSFQWYPRDFAAAMYQLGVADRLELAYRRALDASWDEGAYGVGAFAEWVSWGRVPPDLEVDFRRLMEAVAQVQPNGDFVQLRMVRERMEQARRYESSAQRGAKGGRKSLGGRRRKPPQAVLKQIEPHSSASASASAVEEKEEAVFGVGACSGSVAPAGDGTPTHRLDPRFADDLIRDLEQRHPTRDVGRIAATVAAEYPGLDSDGLARKLRTWCRSADNHDLDRKAGSADAVVQAWAKDSP